jgi:hypothetical protein
MTADLPTSSALLPSDVSRRPAVTRAVVFVTTNHNPRQGCRSFRCPRQAEVVVRFAHEIGDAVHPSPDWFWCLGHWPALREMFREKGHRIEYSADALEMVDAVEQAGSSLRAAIPKQPSDGHDDPDRETAGTTTSSLRRAVEYADEERS